MRGSAIKSTAVALAVFFTASCKDTPLVPSSVTPDLAPVSEIVGKPRSGSSTNSFLCYTSIRTPDGPDRYRYSHLELHLPNNALAPDGGTMLYRFRIRREGRDPSFVANCIIPRTDEAIEFMHRRFHVGRDAVVMAERRQPDGDEIVIQGCVTGGVCELEALVVVTGECANPEWTEGEDGVCRSARGSTSGGTTGGYWWEGAGGGGDSPDPGDPAECEEDCAHTFKFSGTMRRDGPGRSPAWYTISGPTSSEDTWWIAESGKINVVCNGRWISRYLWIGQAFVIADDLHFVMGPGHPDF